MAESVGGGGDSFVLDLGRQRAVINSIGGVLAAVLGASALGASIFGGVSGGTGARIVAGVLGTLLLAFGLVYWRAHAGGVAPGEKARLVIDRSGLRVDDPEGSWALSWDEIATVRVKREFHTTGQVGGPDPYYRLQIETSRPDVAAAHPELSANLTDTSVITTSERDLIRLVLSVSPHVKHEVEAAVARFAPTTGH